MNDILPDHLEYNFFGWPTRRVSYMPIFLPKNGTVDHALIAFHERAAFDKKSFAALRATFPEKTEMNGPLDVVVLKVDQGGVKTKDNYIEVVGFATPPVLKNVTSEKSKRLQRHYNSHQPSRPIHYFLDDAVIIATQCVMAYAAASKYDNEDVKVLAAQTLHSIYKAAPTIAPEIMFGALHLGSFSDSFKKEPNWKYDLGIVPA